MPHPPAFPGAIDMQALAGLCTAEQLHLKKLFGIIVFKVYL